MGLVPWLARMALSGRPSRRTPFDLPLALFLATAGLGVWSAYDREAAWAKFWLIVGAALLFYAFANWGTSGMPGAANQQAWLIAALGAVMAGYFLLTHDWDAFPTKIRFLSQLGRALQAPLPVIASELLVPDASEAIMVVTVPFGLTAPQFPGQ